MKKAERMIWMFPRNKRRLCPIDAALSLRAMFAVCKPGSVWAGAQEAQNTFSKVLDRYHLKRGEGEVAPRSGGGRTYKAQFQALGFIEVRGETVTLTKAGEELVSLKNPSDILRRQILRCEFPSDYTRRGTVRISPEIQVRPFSFLLKLAADHDINGLSDKDAVIPVVFGKTDKSFRYCKSLILKARRTSLSKVLPNTARIRTPKTAKATFSSRIEDIKEIANTFRNILISADLMETVVVGNEVRAFPRMHVWASAIMMDKSSLFQRKLKVRPFRLSKVARRNTTFLHRPDEVVIRKFLKRNEFPVSLDAIDTFAYEMREEFSLPRERVVRMISPILPEVSV